MEQYLDRAAAVLFGLLFAWGGRWIFFHPEKAVVKLSGDREPAGRFYKRYLQVIGAFFLYMGLGGACIAIVPEYFADRYGAWVTIFPLATSAALTFLLLRRNLLPAQNLKR